MAFVVVHFLFAMLLGAVIVLLFRKKPTLPLLLVAGLGGTLLDADIVLDFLFPHPLHRVFTHNLLIPLVLFLVSALLAAQPKTRWFALPVVLFAAGWITHIALDCVIAWTPEMQLFPGIPMGFCPSGVSWQAQGALDGAVFLGWILYLLWTKKIKA